MTDQEDAKLKAAQRKKLKGSQFCGPGRSFPVNDCAHVRAALRLLNRAKVSSATKAKIRACVNRKNKSMGCGVNSGDALEDQEVIDLCESEEFDDTRSIIDFLEELETSRTPVDAAIDALRERCALTLQHLREQDEDEVALDTYRSRNVFSLMDAILDELEK